MDKSFVLLVAVVLTALTAACSVYDTYIVRPVEAGDLERANLCGVTTRAGEQFRFSPVPMAPNGSFALLRSDTLLTHVDWWARRFAVADLSEVWLRRRAPAKSFLASALVAGGFAVAVWQIRSLNRGTARPVRLRLPPDHISPLCPPLGPR